MLFFGAALSEHRFRARPHHLRPAITSDGVGTFICELDGLPFSTLQGDGLLIATPTGSTAYSLSAGGPIVSPQLSALLFTPLSPLSLSARPLVLPPNATLRIRLADDSRHTATVVLDGVVGEAQTLHPGEYVELTKSMHPLVLADVLAGERCFIDNVTSKLGWNTRWRNPADD